MYRGDLRTVYYDPSTNITVAAWIPEAHASSSCPRALRRGRAKVKVDQPESMAWCDVCTTPDAELATIRSVNGRWIPVQRLEAEKPNDRS